MQFGCKKKLIFITIILLALFTDFCWSTERIKDIDLACKKKVRISILNGAEPVIEPEEIPYGLMKATFPEIPLGISLTIELELLDDLSNVTYTGEKRDVVVDSSSYYIPFDEVDFDVVKPVKPSNFKANIVPPDQISLSWTDNSTNEYGFKIERKTKINSSEEYTEVIDVEPNQTGYRDNVSLSVNGSHSYRIQAYNSGGNSEYINAYRNVTINHRWLRITAGNSITMGIKADDSLWAWGSNKYGQLGDGTTEDQNTPIRISTGAWSLIALSYQSYVSGFPANVLGVKTDGTLWFWNNNDSMEYRTTGGKILPVQVEMDNNWRSVTTSRYYPGNGHTLALRTDGTLWAWGYNYDGQLGIPIAPLADKYIPTQIGGDFDWSVIVTGHSHTVALKEDGSLWAWGYNQYGQLGDGTTENKNSPVQVGAALDWSAIAAGYSHTVALKGDGSLWAWGYNQYGQLGDGTTENKNFPVQIGVALDWSAIAVGGSHTVALKGSGSLWAWGNNQYGQLGDSTTEDRNSPIRMGSNTDWSVIAAGGSHTVALKGSGSLWAWGNNQYGQLGDGTTEDRNFPIRMGNNIDWSVIVAGDSHTLALKKNGSLWIWVGGVSNLMNGFPMQIGGTDWSTMEIGGNHVVVIKKNSSLWAWGDNQYGQLGDGTTENKNFPVRIENDIKWSVIAAGNSHTVALKKDGSLWAWGYNAHGQLGDGNNGIRRESIPIQINHDIDWLEIASGAFHTAAIKSNNTLWVWGSNDDGQLGLGDETVKRKDVPTQVGSDTDWIKTVSGAFYTAALKANGTLWIWGSNDSGQLGLGDETIGKTYTPTQVGSNTDWLEIAAGAFHLAALKANGTLWTWGSNDSGQLGLGDETIGKTYIPMRVGSDADWGEITAGYSHTAALRKNGSLWVWGDNRDGQLGDGTTEDKYSPALVTEGSVFFKTGSKFEKAVAENTILRIQYLLTVNVIPEHRTQLRIYDPNNVLYGIYSLSEEQQEIMILDAESGLWSYTITSALPEIPEYKIITTTISKPYSDVPTLSHLGIMLICLFILIEKTIFLRKA